MQLPAHLQALAQFNSAAAAIGGITAGVSLNSIGIKGSRWRIQHAQGEETVVQQLHLDVIVVDANPNLSKVFYLGAYNPADTEFKAPDCYSDNGVAPSARASKPQCSTCAACPHNVWGSKITPSGSQTKACADSKKLAVLLADNPTGPIYQLKLPAASLKNLYAIVQGMQARGIPLPAMVLRLTFDSTADYPKVLFAPAAWTTPEQLAAVMHVAGTDEVKQVTGVDDVARAEAIAAPVAAPAAQFVPIPAPVQQTPFDPFAGIGYAPPSAPQPSMPAAGPLASPAAAAADAAPKRTRRSKAQIQADAEAKIAQGAAPALAVPPVGNSVADPFAGVGFNAQAPQPVSAPAFDVPGAIPPAASVQIAPQLSTTALDDLLSKALQV
jgi:hypothetical protein